MQMHARQIIGVSHHVRELSPGSWPRILARPGLSSDVQRAEAIS